MKNYFVEIRSKLKKEINFEDLEIVDNSYKHIKHKSYSTGKLYLHLKFKSSYLDSMSRLNAQKKIMTILKDDLRNKIHALEISIEQ